MWEPILASDLGRPATEVLRLFDDRRVVQVWDPDRRIAATVARAKTVRPQEPACCESDGVLWDLAAIYTPGSRWNEDLPAALWWDGAVVRVAARLEEELLKAAATR